MEAYVGQSSNKTALLKINVDKHGELAQKYGVRSIPSFRVYDARGKLLAEGDEARSWVMERLDQ